MGYCCEGITQAEKQRNLIRFEISRLLCAVVVLWVWELMMV